MRITYAYDAVGVKFSDSVLLIDHEALCGANKFEFMLSSLMCFFYMSCCMCAFASLR